MTAHAAIEAALATGDEADGGGLFGGALDVAALDGARDAKGNLPDTLFRDIRAVEKRGRGRPKGSTNRKARDLQKLLAERGTDPVILMHDIANMPLDVMLETMLIAEHQAYGDRNAPQFMKRGELAIKAMNLKLAAAREVAPFVHSKKATQVEATVRTDGVLIMADVSRANDSGEAAQAVNAAGELLAQALAKGMLDLRDLSGLQLINGQLTYDGETVVGLTGDDDDVNDEAHA